MKNKMTDKHNQSVVPMRLNPVLAIFLVFPLMGIMVALSMGLSTQRGSVTITPPVVTFVSTSLVNSPAPDFTLPTLTGSSVQLSNLRGKWVFLNFWATWCTPCRQEMPTFQQFINGKFGATDNVTILAVDNREGADQVKNFLAELKLTVPVVLDTDGSVDTLYQIVQLPITYLIDPAGIVRYKHIGMMTPEYFQEYLAQTASKKTN